MGIMFISFHTLYIVANIDKYTNPAHSNELQLSSQWDFYSNSHKSIWIPSCVSIVDTEALVSAGLANVRSYLGLSSIAQFGNVFWERKQFISSYISNILLTKVMAQVLLLALSHSVPEVCHISIIFKAYPSMTRMIPSRHYLSATCSDSKELVQMWLVARPRQARLMQYGDRISV